MKIGEITIVNEFTEEKAYEITDFLQNNSDRIKGIGIEAFSSTDKSIPVQLNFVREVKYVLETINDFDSQIPGSLVAVYGEEMKEEIYKIVIKFFDGEFSLCSPIFA